jgi:hypothetical protein
MKELPRYVHWAFSVGVDSFSDEGPIHNTFKNYSHFFSVCPIEFRVVPSWRHILSSSFHFNVYKYLLAENNAMKAYGGSGIIAPLILEVGTGWRWVVSFTPRPRTPRERAYGTHWIGGLVGPRTGLNAVVKWKIPSPCRDSNHRSSSP